jgi:hypothetical protein
MTATWMLLSGESSSEIKSQGRFGNLYVFTQETGTQCRTHAEIRRLSPFLFFKNFIANKSAVTHE